MYGTLFASIVNDEFYKVLLPPEADLGMFSMFAQTGAPTKKGPHKRAGKFLQHSNMPEIIEIIIRTQILCASNYVMRVLNKMSMMTTLSLCVSCEFSLAIRILRRGPHIFSEQGPA